MPWTYRPALDGLRTIAVYLVLLFHTGLPWMRGGFIGVDLFFVLSGFLVSSVILAEIEDTGRLRIGKFYARRARRLLPAAVAVIVATSAMFLIIWSVVRRLPLVADAQSALLYVANWHFLGQAGDYFATDIEKSPFLHFWSLAIEEQFYLVFPLLLILLSRTTRKRMFAVLAGLFSLSLAAQVYWGQVDTTHAYYGTDARLYQLLAGAMLAVGLRIWSVRVSQRRLGVIATLGLVGLVVLGSSLVGVSASWRGIGAMVVSVLLIGGLMLGETSLAARLLSRPVPVFLGRVSYGTYLWHWPVILAFEEFLDVSPKVVAVLAIAVSTGLAAVSYEVLEMPIRKSTYLDRVRWNPALAGVAASTLVAVTLVPTLLEMDRPPAVAGLASGPAAAAAGGRSPQIPKDIDWDRVRKDIGREGWCTADDVPACTVVRGSGPHVLLVGDSQAQMLVPMFQKIAEEHDLTLSLNVVAGCLWQEGLINLKASPEGQEQCNEARPGWYDEVLPKLRPDVVILLDRPRDDPEEWTGVVTRRDGKKQPLEQAILETTGETLDKISAVAAKTLIVERLIMPETFEPGDCLSTVTEAGQCAVPVPLGSTPSDGYYLTAAAQSPKISTLDLNPAFCPGAPICQPVVRGRVVWRDNHHVTARFAIHRRDHVWRILQESGAFGDDG